MAALFKLFKKLIPRNIDMLVYYFPEQDKCLELPEVQGIPLEQNGDEFTIIKQGQLVHRSRIFHKSHLLSNFHFTQPLVTIGDCFTNDHYRGLGIYPKVISYLGKKYSSSHQVYILVAPDNIPSIKGIEKAGFTFMARLQGFRFLIFYFKKKLSIKTP